MKKKISILAIILTLLMTSFSFAHSGRTDASGGHHDYKNKSGLGGYHYHCGGYPPHLHTNGVCPYSKNSSQNKNISKKSSTTNKYKKQKVAKQGYSDGYEVGYGNKNASDYSYSGSYESTYESNYSKGYDAGVAKLEKDIEEVKTIAYEIGLKGKEQDKTYSNESLQSAYEESYEDGYNKYVEEETEKYKQQGKEDGQNDKEKQVFSEDINQEFIDAYNLAYESEQEILCSNYTNEGFNDAIQGINSKVSKYQNIKFAKWYKEGYEEGCSALKQAKTDAYNQGYNKEDFKVTEKMELAESELEKNYNEGLEKKQSEEKKTATTVGVGAIAVAGGAGFLVSRNKKKKIKF